MMKLKKYFSAVWILIFVSCAAVADSSEKKEIEKAYQAWCTAIGTAKGDAQKIVKYYAPGAILFPTLSSQVLINQNGGFDAYFTELTSYPQIKCTTQKRVTRTYGDLVGVNAGLYDFSYIDKEGAPKTLEARFTFVYEKFGEKWLIVSHHSSLKPEKG